MQESTRKPEEGLKLDSGKPRLSLLPWNAVLEIVEVLEFGARKYSVDNWKCVENSRERYFDACMRHLIAWKEGEKSDPETGYSHLAHAGCCMLFLLWGEITGGLKNGKS